MVIAGVCARARIIASAAFVVALTIRLAPNRLAPDCGKTDDEAR